MLLLLEPVPPESEHDLNFLKTKRAGTSIKIIDKNDRAGGLARTYYFSRHYFDVGPHRFYTRNKELFTLWNKILGKDFKKVKRLTRIYYNGELFTYPLQLADVLRKLGFLEGFLCFLSFVKSKTNPNKNPESFEEWVIQKIW